MKVTIDTGKKIIQVVSATEYEIKSILPCMVEDFNEYKVAHKKPRQSRKKLDESSTQLELVTDSLDISSILKPSILAVNEGEASFATRAMVV